jgi:hypothetical protein
LSCCCSSLCLLRLLRLLLLVLCLLLLVLLALLPLTFVCLLRLLKLLVLGDVCRRRGRRIYPLPTRTIQLLQGCLATRGARCVRQCHLCPSRPSPATLCLRSRRLGGLYGLLHELLLLLCMCLQGSYGARLRLHLQRI